MARMGNLVILVLCLLGFLVAQNRAAYTPVDNYLIDCGASQKTTVDGRDFQSDSQSSSLLSTSQAILVTTASASVPSDLYLTARVFVKQSSYTFNIQQEGRHWVRLYFYPVPHPVYDLKSALFSVTTEKFVLLHNFSMKVDATASTYLFKEYLINVTSDSLTLTFAPMNSSIAFINAIEVVSVPDLLTSNVPMVLSPLGSFTGLPEIALETTYRLNVGGQKLTPKNDTLGRTWASDQSYLSLNSSAQNISVPASSINYPSSGTVTAEIAPNYVYATAEEMGNANVSNENFNITWAFSVDPDFSYFVRMHFCDIVSKALNEFVFNVFINSQTAINNLDLSSKTSQLATAYYTDFVVNGTGSSKLTVSIGPSSLDNGGSNAILNGLEIMKMSNEAGSLDGPYSVDGIIPGASKSSTKVGPIVGSVVGAAAALVLLAGGYYCFLRAPKSKSKHSPPAWLPLPLHGGNSHSMGSKVSTISHKSGTGSYVSSAQSNLGRYFTFAEIQEATNKFDESLLLGVGGFGKVYQGQLEDGTKVAVKRGNPRSEQGLTEFQTEIEMLSKLRHRHLVSLIGYCEEHCEMILVYEYMANGPLRSHLYGSNLPSLSWKQRLEVCIGAARGLHYLHTGAAQGIIHRDVKTTNILLDENLVAKVADFGLSKTGPTLDQTHVSTAVKGSFGYLDPEYFRRQQLTEKSDVYSFGVVLLEVLCARPALNPVLPREQVNIAEWAMHYQKKGMLDQIIDSHLAGTINPGSLKKFGETAEKCLEEQGIDRPAMGDVLWNLEYAYQLQETAMRNDPDENSTNHIAEIPLRYTQPEPFDTSIIDRGSDDDLADATTSAVFSQLVNPRGR
ncbi:receptor-like protein kinase THESEUS 1 [Cryptomeria japonica]|uniref:receptor-like protein kinase THESEUS 1 n=1 Tax=Cryptomeria japonica TaxID=3369 RepID=UPI0025ACE391|nr:receptor-like protein kinase THESEUS 1 [Cryptomeria japonica]